MINKANKNVQRKTRHLRVRKNISGTAECPRLDVYRSTNHIYAQVIDDVNGTTICSASTIQKNLASQLEGKTKSEQAFVVGEAVGKLAVEKGIKEVVFDRGGYLYTGRVMNVAEGARKAGLVF